MNAARLPSFGELVKRYREVAGLTQEALAERAGLSVRGLRYLEQGVRQPYPDTVRRLADALALPPRDRATFAVAARLPHASARTRADRTAAAPPVRPAQGAASLSSARRRPAPALVGRTWELAVLERHLEGEGPPVLLLAGEPGIGKTRLLDEAVDRAGNWGWTALAGGCQRRGGQEPYAPLLGALQHYIQGQGHGQLRADLQGCAWLVRLLPELAQGPIEPLPAWTLPQEQERRLMVEAVRHFLDNVAGAAGTLLVLDDLQWASPDALDLLATLARSAVHVPVRLVGAYRDTEVASEAPLSVLLADLAHAGLLTHHALAPLTVEETAQLLDGLLAGEEVAPALRANVLRRAGGVPFFAVSYAQGLRLSPLAGRREDAVPWDVAQSIRQRVAVLPRAAREVLGVAAVVGRLVPHALLVALRPQGTGQVLAALEVACQGRLLEELDAETYQFAHDVIREVIEADLGAVRRMVLHRRIAEELERHPGEPPVERLAYHYSRGGVPDKAVLYLEQAGDRAEAQYAHTVTEGYYRELLDRLDRMGRAVDAAPVRERLGAVLRTGGRYDAALEVLEQAAETYRATGDLERLGVVSGQIGEVHADRGTAAEGVERLQALLVALEERGAWHGAAALYLALTDLLWHAGRYPEQLAVAERATALARALGDVRMLADAEMQRAFALLAVGRGAEALPVLEGAMRVAEQVGDLTTLCDALAMAGGIHCARGEFDAHRSYNERAVALAVRLGNVAAIVGYTTTRGQGAFFRGEWGPARVDFERALAVSRQTGRSWLSAAPLAGLGHLFLAEGAWQEASQYLEEGVRTLERSGTLPILCGVQSLLAERDLRAGHPYAARTRLASWVDRHTLEEDRQTLEIGWHVMPPLVLLAWALLELGEVAQAAAMVTQAITRERASHTRLALVEALWVQAMVLTRQERWTEAEHALEEGLSLAHSMPYPYAEARLLHVYGQMHAQKGQMEPARQRLDAALALFQRLGARADAARVEQAIADLPRL